MTKAKRFSMWILLSILIVQCSDKTGDEGFEKARNFVQSVEEQKLVGLLHLMLVPRGTDQGKHRLQKIQINRTNEDPILIPVFDETTTPEAVLASSTFDIFGLAELNQIDSVNAFQYAREYSDKIVNQYNKLGVIAVKSYPDLGDFIIFQITAYDQAILLVDKKKIHHEYWVKFFKESRKLDGDWYYRKEEIDRL